MGLKKKNILEMSLDEYRLKDKNKLDKASKMRKKKAGFKNKDGQKTLRVKQGNKKFSGEGKKGKEPRRKFKKGIRNK